MQQNCKSKHYLYKRNNVALTSLKNINEAKKYESKNKNQ